MDIINNIRNMFGNPRTVSTPYGTLNLARREDARKLQGAVISLQRQTDALTRKDIGDWRQAWQLAINAENPNRQRLYDIYRDVEVDLHLSGCIAQRQGFVLSRSFKLVNEKGEEDDELLEIFDAEWFKQLMLHTLSSNWWGHSLIQLGEVVISDGGHPAYAYADLLPRKHVIPEYGKIIRELGMEHTQGIPYREPPYNDFLIEVGSPSDLGLYLKAATQTIPKKNMLAFWDTFGEIFGMPMRVARTTSRDDKDISRLERMLRDSGTKLTAVMGMDTEIQFIETGKADAYNVYDKRIDRANSEISKLVIGQTMTIEDGSSLSQSETHLKVFQNLVESDCDKIRDMVNNQLLPRMLRHGFPVKGRRFEWDYSVDYTPEQQVAYEQLVLNSYEVDPAYFGEKYNMPVGERRKQIPELAPTGKDNGTSKQDEEKLMVEHFRRLEKEMENNSVEDIDAGRIMREALQAVRSGSFFD